MNLFCSDCNATKKGRHYLVGRGEERCSRSLALLDRRLLGGVTHWNIGLILPQTTVPQLRGSSRTRCTPAPSHRHPPLDRGGVPWKGGDVSQWCMWCFGATMW